MSFASGQLLVVSVVLVASVRVAPAGDGDPPAALVALQRSCTTASDAGGTRSSA